VLFLLKKLEIGLKKISATIERYIVDKKFLQREREKRRYSREVNNRYYKQNIKLFIYI